jgi:uncharacterized protein YqeY
MINKHGIDQEALIQKFSEATAQQGEAVRKVVTEATLKALQGRELTLANIRQVLASVTKAASAGVAKSPLDAVDVESVLANAVAGMDDALEKAVQANRIALQQMVEQGVSVRETHLKKALSDIDKMEDSLFSAIRKAAAQTGDMQMPWSSVLSAAQGKGTGTGAQAAATLEQFMDTAQQNLREGRELGMRASQAMLDGYATLVSGVLMGMADALKQPEAKPAATARKK